MAKEYVIVYGGIFTGGKRLGVGESVTLEESAAKDMDPTGALLKLKIEVDASIAGKKAEAEHLAKALKKETK